VPLIHFDRLLSLTSFSQFGFKVLTALTMKNIVSWNMMPCSLALLVIYYLDSSWSVMMEAIFFSEMSVDFVAAYMPSQRGHCSMRMCVPLFELGVSCLCGTLLYIDFKSTRTSILVHVRCRHSGYNWNDFSRSCFETVVREFHLERSVTIRF
jgi:hypothetical protein